MREYLSASPLLRQLFDLLSGRDFRRDGFLMSRAGWARGPRPHSTSHFLLHRRSACSGERRGIKGQGGFVEVWSLLFMLQSSGAAWLLLPGLAAGVIALPGWGSEDQSQVKRPRTTVPLVR